MSPHDCDRAVPRGVEGSPCVEATGLVGREPQPHSAGLVCHHWALSHSWGMKGAGDRAAG